MMCSKANQRPYSRFSCNMVCPRFTDRRAIGVRIVCAFVCCATVLTTACQREKRDVRPSPTRLAIFGDAARESPLRPGGPVQPQPVVTNPYNGSSYDIAQ